MALITDPDQLNQATEVTITTGTKKVLLSVAGNLSNDGVTMQALYSFLKEEWKNDPLLIPHPFPLIAITPEQFEWVEDWEPTNNTTRKLIRTGGWKEVDSNSVVKKEYAGIISLGSFEDSANDLAYYIVGNDPTDTAAAINFDFAGPLNEPILTYDNVTPADTGTGFDFNNASPDTIDRNDGGSWITDGYKVGAQIEVSNANTAGNNGTYDITVVTAATLTVTAVGGGDAGLTADLLDTTATFATDYRSSITLFLRVRDADPNGKVFDISTLSNIGVTTTTNQVYRFPLANATDLKISETDANIGANSPYTQIVTRYFDQAFAREVDTPGTQRDFGIVIDVGTHSGVDGSFTAAASVLTSTEGGIPTDATYTGGTLTIHEGTDAATVFTISGTPTATTVTITGTFTATESNISFTLQRTTPVTATTIEIYEKIQYLLRQASDIDSTDQVVTGKTADALLRFVGDTLEAGQAIPNNPNGGGSGVVIEGFDANDTNSLTFYDNTATSRNFPFVAAGTLNFNNNLVNDTGPAEYFMFFEYTTRTSVADLAISGASGNTASIDSAGSNLPTVVQNDYFNLLGSANPENNGIWQVTDATPTAAQFDASKVDTGVTVVNETAFAGTIDDDPINSPDAILVDNNSAADITGTISQASIAFDFDYDGNTQGGRTAATDAAVVIRAIGLGTAQFVETTGTITRNTGLVFSLVAALERNYSNP